MRVLGDEFDKRGWTIYSEIGAVVFGSENAILLNLKSVCSAVNYRAQNGTFYRLFRINPIAFVEDTNLLVQAGDKTALRFDGADYTLFVNGVLSLTIGVSTVDTDFTELDIGSGGGSVIRKDLVLYPAGQTDAELITLTGG